jgi:tight adherence protein C
MAEEGHLAARAKRRREERSRRLQDLLENLGARVGGSRDASEVKLFLMHAGFTGPSAVPIYLGGRLFFGLGLGGFILLSIPLFGLPALAALFGALWGFLFGWMVPLFLVGARARRRQHDMVKALPDALDLLVVCVEAGLGLNQALVRVAGEITNVSAVLGEQISLTNLEIRAGTPRDEALRHFGERTGVEDIRSFVAMLIQTDRFGTSIAQALRTHAEVLRTKRRQRAEEASAKTAIKMLFPLVFFIFPAMFVVILGPAVIQIYDTLSKTF